MNKPFDQTHFCKSCGNIAQRLVGTTMFYCGRCGTLVSVMSVPNKEESL